MFEVGGVGINFGPAVALDVAGAAGEESLETARHAQLSPLPLHFHVWRQRPSFSPSGLANAPAPTTSHWPTSLYAMKVDMHSSPCVKTLPVGGLEPCRRKVIHACVLGADLLAYTRVMCPTRVTGAHA